MKSLRQISQGQVICFREEIAVISLGQSSHDRMDICTKYSATSASMNILSSRLHSLSLELTSPLGLTSCSFPLKLCSPGGEVKAE